MNPCCGEDCSSASTGAALRQAIEECEVCNDDIPRDAPCPACDGKGVIHHYTQGRRDE